MVFKNDVITLFKGGDRGTSTELCLDQNFMVQELIPWWLLNAATTIFPREETEGLKYENCGMLAKH